jgi:hypothetical protein
MKRFILFFVLFFGLQTVAAQVTVSKKGKVETLLIKSKAGTKTINLKKLSIYDNDDADENFYVINYKTFGGTTKVILAYTYPSDASNPNGSCGGGNEFGYIELHLTASNKIIRTNKVIVESCWNKCEYEEIKKSEFLDIFKVTKKETIYTVTVDKKLMQVTVKEEL